MTIPDPTYITEAELTENTLITALGALAGADRTKLIQAAESQIDAYCGRQPHHPFDDNIDRVFPRVQDYSITISGGSKHEYPDTPVIPLAVSLACLRQVEWLYTQWWSDRASKELPTNYAVESQAIGGDGSYSETRAHGGTSFADATLCDQAKIHLNGYAPRFVGLSTTDVRTSPVPNGF